MKDGRLELKGDELLLHEVGTVARLSISSIEKVEIRYGVALAHPYVLFALLAILMMAGLSTWYIAFGGPSGFPSHFQIPLSGGGGRSSPQSAANALIIAGMFLPILCVVAFVFLFRRTWHFKIYTSNGIQIAFTEAEKAPVMLKNFSELGIACSISTPVDRLA